MRYHTPWKKVLGEAHSPGPPAMSGNPRLRQSSVECPQRTAPSLQSFSRHIHLADGNGNQIQRLGNLLYNVIIKRPSVFIFRLFVDKKYRVFVYGAGYIICDNHLVIGDELTKLLNLSIPGSWGDIGFHFHRIRIFHVFFAGFVATSVLPQFCPLVQKIPKRPFVSVHDFHLCTSHGGRKRHDFPHKRRRHIAALIRPGNAIFAMRCFPLCSALVDEICGDLNLVDLVACGDSSSICPERKRSAENLAGRNTQIRRENRFACLSGHVSQHGQFFFVAHLIPPDQPVTALVLTGLLASLAINTLRL
nr:MAG TPA: hypothetical protein [Caudoviricetes sp.]